MISLLFSGIWHASVTGMLIWVFNKLTNTICTSKTSLVGKTALVTGGNKGIGFETSLGLAARGCRVIIVCRSDAEREKQSLIKQTNNPNIIVKRTDLSSMAEVRKLAEDLKKSESKLDILINNAVLFEYQREFTPEGLERNLASSVLGPFLLTCLLTDLLKKSEQGRIIFLSSILIWISNLQLNELNIDKELNMISYLQSYGNFKLCNLITSNMFGKKLKPFGITSNAVHPGLVNTNLWTASENVVHGFIAKFLYILYRIFFKNAEEGAQLTLKVATDPIYRKTSGRLVWDFPLPIPSQAKNKQFCDELWKTLEKLVKIQSHESIN